MFRGQTPISLPPHIAIRPAVFCQMSLNAQVFTLKSVFVAMAAIQFATAAVGTLVPLVFAQVGASQEAASFAASAYSAGFLIGCFVVAKSIVDFGHIRAFASAAATATAAALLFDLTDNVSLFIGLRFLMGLATAGLFAIGDAWINEAAEEKSRGRVLSIYAIVIGIVSIFSQTLIFLIPDDAKEAFSLAALVYCFSILTISSTRTAPPDRSAVPRVRLKGLFNEAPAAAVGAFVLGMVSTTILSVAPFSAIQLGISAPDVALMIGAIYLGRVLLQYPLGHLSDRMDRRITILATSAVSTCVLLAMALLADPDVYAPVFDYFGLAYFILMTLMILLGASLFTLYSIMTAHALDRTVPVYVSAAAVTMLFVWTIGSIAGPLLANVFTAIFGDVAMLWMNFGVMLGYVLFLSFRIKKAAPVSFAEQSDHANILPTSTEMAANVK